MDIQKGDIVQISDFNHPWFPCLVIVDEVKGWGVQACVLVPKSNSENEISEAWNRLTYDKIEKVGTAAFVKGVE